MISFHFSIVSCLVADACAALKNILQKLPASPYFCYSQLIKLFLQHTEHSPYIEVGKPELDGSLLKPEIQFIETKTSFKQAQLV